MCYKVTSALSCSLTYLDVEQFGAFRQRVLATRKDVALSGEIEILRREQADRFALNHQQ